MPQKQINPPALRTHNINIECVSNFSFLGIKLDKHMSWKSHIDSVYTKISRSVGILNRLKHFLPLNIKLNIYNSLILPHINYGILLWGTRGEGILKLQKKALRIICLKKYNAHTEPLFKSLNVLKIQDIFNMSQLKFYYKLVNNNLPEFFQTLPFYRNNAVH